MRKYGGDASANVELVARYFATEYLATKSHALTDQIRDVSRVCISSALPLLQGFGRRYEVAGLKMLAQQKYHHQHRCSGRARTASTLKYSQAAPHPSSSQAIRYLFTGYLATKSDALTDQIRAVHSSYNVIVVPMQ